MQGGPVGPAYNALAPWPLGWRSDKQESGSVSVWTRDYPRLSGTNILSGWLPSLLCIFFNWFPQQRFSFSFNSLADYTELSCKRTFYKLCILIFAPSKSTLLDLFPIEMYTWNFISNQKCISFGGSINYYHHYSCWSVRTAQKWQGTLQMILIQWKNPNRYKMFKSVLYRSSQWKAP